MFDVLTSKPSLWEDEDRLFVTLSEHIEDRSVVAVAAHEDEALELIEIEENFLRDLHIKIAFAP